MPERLAPLGVGLVLRKEHTVIVRKHFTSEQDEAERVMKAASRGIKGVPGAPKAELPTKPASVESLEWLLGVQHALKQTERDQLVAKARSRPQTLDEAARLYGTSRWVIAGHVKRHDIRTEKIGQSVCLDIRDLEPYLGKIK
jgi:transcriptional regulator with GAF, ATPase, and Fis domain